MVRPENIQFWQNSRPTLIPIPADHKLFIAQPELPSSTDYLLPASSYQGDNRRISMFGIVTKATEEIRYLAPVPTTDVLWTTDSLVNEIKEHGQILPSTKELMTPAILELFKSSPTGLLTVRRAYWNSESGKPVSGPTLNAFISAEEAFTHLETMIQKGLTLQSAKPSLEIRAFLQHWDDPGPVQDKLSIFNLPRGGDIVPEHIDTDGSIILRVQATPGDNAAISQLGSIAHIDTFRLRFVPGNGKPPEVNLISSNIVPQKRHCFLQRISKPTTKAKAINVRRTNEKSHDSNWWSVEINQANDLATPLLSIGELQRIGLIAGQIILIEGSQKIEFVMTKRIDPESGKAAIVPVFNDVEPWEIIKIENSQPIERARGAILSIIHSYRDVINLEKLLELRTGIKNPIVILSTRCIVSWNSDTAIPQALAKLRKKCIFLAPTGDTEHHVVELRDSGHTVYPIQTYTQYDAGTPIKVMTRLGHNYIELDLDKSESHLPPLLYIDDAIARGLIDPDSVGGKMSGLIRLLQAGFQIPPHTSATSESFFRELIQLNALEKLLQQLPHAKSEKELRKLFYLVSRRLINLPDKMLREIFVSQQALNGKNAKVGIRSNLNLEDLRGSRFAGIFDTELNVSLQSYQQFKTAYLKVLRSYFTPKAASSIYHHLAPIKRTKVLSNLLGSVIIQPMVKRVIASGTLFGHEDGEQGNRDIIVLEAGFGTAAIVDGKNTNKIEIRFDKRRNRPESIVLYQKDQKPVFLYNFRGLTRKRHILNYQDVINLTDLAQLQSAKLDGAQDVEWTLQSNGSIVFIQSRPM